MGAVSALSTGQEAANQELSWPIRQAWARSSPYSAEGHSLLMLRPKQEVTVSGGCKTTSELSSREGEGHLSTPGGTAASYLRSDGGASIRGLVGKASLCSSSQQRQHWSSLFEMNWPSNPA